MRHFLLFLSAALTACSANPVADDGSGEFGKSDSAFFDAQHDTHCVVDSIMVRDGYELGQDLVDAIDPSFLVHFGGRYHDQIRIPGAFQTWVIRRESSLTAYQTVNTLHGWDLVRNSERRIETQENEGELIAEIAGSTFHRSGDLGARRYEVAKALFDSLTQVDEDELVHDATGVYDSSYTIRSRASRNRRLICQVEFDHINDPNETFSTYTCRLNNVESKRVQSYDPTYGYCPTAN